MMTTCWPEGEPRDRDHPGVGRDGMRTKAKTADKDRAELAMADGADMEATRTPAGPRRKIWTSATEFGHVHTH